MNEEVNVNFNNVFIEFYKFCVTGFMQSNGLIFFLILFIAFPLLVISSNHNIFFIVLAVIILILSSMSIISALFNIKNELSEEDQELIEEIEATTDIDVKKIGLGTSITKEMVWLLFFIYCAFIIDILWLKVILAAVMAFYAFSIFINIKNRDVAAKQLKIGKWAHISLDVATIFIIISTAIIKYKM